MNEAAFQPWNEEKKLQKKLKEARESKDQQLQNQIIKALVHLYILYGEHFKMSERPEPRVAEMYLKKALRLQPNHPVANYRLAHLLYRKKEYIKALSYFERSLEGSEDEGLNDTQVMLAHMFMVNCGYLITRESLKEIEALENNPYSELEFERIERYQTEMLIENESILNRIFYRKISDNKEEFISGDEFAQPRLHQADVVLRMSDQGMEILFHQGRPISLHPTAFYLICCLLRTGDYLSAEDLATIIFQGPLELPVKEDNIRQTILRLKRNLPFWDLVMEEITIPGSGRKTGRKRKDGISYCILCRAGDILPDDSTR